MTIFYDIFKFYSTIYFVDRFDSIRNKINTKLKRNMEKGDKKNNDCYFYYYSTCMKVGLYFLCNIKLIFSVRFAIILEVFNNDSDFSFPCTTKV